ncbi:MAG: hypothetical protein JNL83_34465 [Myxococcales bacterium]|nr:hypothetical protein [Myxococcales bacterium]
MNDLLASAVSAARTVADDGADDGAATRLRIRESLAKRTSKKRLWTLLAAALGTMFASTAFALQAGWDPPWSSKTEVIAPAAPDPDPPATPGSPRGGRVSAEPSAPETTVRFETVPLPSASGANQALADEAPLPAPPVAADPPAGDPPSAEPRMSRSPAATESSAPPPRTTVAPPVQRPTSRSEEPAPSSAVDRTPSSAIGAGPSIEPPPARAADPARSVEPPEAPVADAELAAYRTAHALHFRGTDLSAALTAWDALLAKFPSGRLAPEARFNRALLLVKLKRWADARAALAPFASAPAGSYRQREAHELLEAIAGR